VFTVPSGEVHGRDAELALIRDELARLAAGAASVVIVEGGSGIGKSRLVAEASSMAQSLGIAVGNGAAEPGESVVELAALLAALVDGREPLIERSDLMSLRARPEQRFWLLQDLQALLERAALASPLLICIDDAQWADSGTVAALRTLPARLADLPVGWLIAVRPAQESTPLVGALDLLKRNGARTVALGPLDHDAVADLTADLLGAEPDEEMLDLAQQAAGSPFLLVEMLLGLREEDRIRVVGGRATPIERRLPNRVQSGMRERLGRLSQTAGEVVTVAASLGRTFSFGDLARTLGSPPSSLLAPVSELLRADLLAERDDKLTFWHDITREAVRASVPVSARRALDRQAADALLESGALPVEVAVQLAASAEPGDEVAITTLLEAAKALATTDPVTAAQFGRRALEIAPKPHPRGGEIVGTTAIALHVAGNSHEAIAFADTELRRTLPAEQEAEVRLSIAGMFAISPEIRIGAGRLALTLPGLPAVLRARHLACLFHNLVTAGRLDVAAQTLEEARPEVESSGDLRASFTLRVAESALEYADGRFGPARDLIAAAYRDGLGAGDDQRLRLAHMWQGELLSVFDRSDEAFALAADGLAAARRDRQGWAYEMFDTWRGRMLFRTGHLADAAATLQRRFVSEDADLPAAVLDAAGIAALGQLSLHTGDTGQVRRLGDVAHIMLARGTPAVQQHAAWLLAVFAIAEGDPAAARGWLQTPIDSGGRAILPRFPLEITDEVQLARIALAAQDDDLGRLALANTERRAELNPGIASMAAAAAHVRGLLHASRADLELAVEGFEGLPHRVAFGSALEDLGVRLATTDRAAGVDVLGRALVVYTEVGAAWDARRVRGRLRDLGVRRRIVAVPAHTEGWAAMTTSELTVARLVADGLTNREVADRLFVSPHTVNSHLRHIFGKLGINSRVELARLAGDEARSVSGAGP
jgi:DNA-binding CsgD family transcriptional regulator